MSDEMTLDILDYEVGDIHIYINFDKFEIKNVNLKFTLKDIDAPFQIIISLFNIIFQRNNKGGLNKFEDRANLYFYYTLNIIDNVIN